jgi:RNA polymerase sporulation-specific sigma factor
LSGVCREELIKTSEQLRVTSFMPLVAHEAGKLAFGNRFTADDLVQEGILAAIFALESYDPGRGSVNGYVRACARNRMISYLRRNGHEYPMDDETLDVHLSVEDSGIHARDNQEIVEERETLYALLGKLSPFEAKTLDAYLKGGGISGAAEIMGCGRKKVDNALQRIRSKARTPVI